MELTVAGGYFIPGKTPQVINKVNELIALGYVPYGTPTYNEASGWVSQLMVSGYGGSATDYTLTTGYLDKTPYFPKKPPVNGNWVLLGSLLARSNNFYVHAWLDGVAAGPAIDLANTVGNLPLDRTTGNLPLDSRVSGVLPIANGGTGADNATEARTNLAAFYRSRSVLAEGFSINTLTGSQDGIYYQGRSAFATAALGYPEVTAGVLVVLTNTANSPEGATQLYLPFNNNHFWRRNYDAATSTWTTWSRLLTFGEFGLGIQTSFYNSDNVTQFISDSAGSSTWSPTNGGGFQSSYTSSRLQQLWLGLDTNLYMRAMTTNNPLTPKTTVAWVSFTKNGTSDANFKRVGDDLPLDVALDNINALEFKYFNYLTDEEDLPPRRGIIAQQAMTVDPQYVHSAEKTGVMTLDSNPLLLDALAAIKRLTQRVAELEEKLK